MFKEQLFAIPPERTIRTVHTPAGITFVRSMTVGEKDAYDLAVQKDGGHRARLLVACCCTERGEPEFDEFDIGKINSLPVSAVEAIVDAAIQVNRLGPGDAEAIRKN